MSLIPFILDLAEELNEFNRNLVTGMDVDDFGFGMYPHELHQQQSSRRPRTVSQFYLLPGSAQKLRQHPYYRGGTGGGTKVCCSKAAAAAAAAQLHESPEKDNDKESTSNVSAGTTAAAAAAVKPPAATAAYSVVNKNGFQVSMNVKQFSPNELTVKTIDNCIVVEGQHDEKEDGHGVISRHFVRKYMLPKGFDPNEVLSTLSSDGILTVKAPPPPPPKAEEEQLERMVQIQHTGPAHLSVKEGGSNQKEKTSNTATVPQLPSQQQQQEEKQKLPAATQQPVQQGVVNERNGDANANEQETEMAEPESASPTASPTTTTSTSASVTASVEPMLVVANNIATPAKTDAIAAVATEENDVNNKENENDTDIADIPMTVSISADIAAGIAAVIPDGVIDSVVVIATVAEAADDGGVAVDGFVVGNNIGDTPTTPPPSSSEAVGMDTTTAKEEIADIPITEPVVVVAAAGDLVAAAAADAAILLAKNQCENGDAKTTAEEISN